MALGALPHIPVGTYFPNRRSLYNASVHRDIRRGICGSGVPGKGVESVVLSGAYEDDVDLGDVIYYTGQGGRDANGIQIADQVMAGVNNSLAINVESGEPVRVVRSTTNGFRYDGLYLVEDAYLAQGRSGYQICRYRLRNLRTESVNKADERERRAAARRQTTHYRLVRDGTVPTQVKALYQHRCQVCLVQVETAAGYYAEGAHLVPLGGGQAGVDHISNVLCLCPNDHVRLDHGAIALDDDWNVIDRQGNVLGTLERHPSHPLDVAYAQQHRQLMGFE